MSFEDMTCKTNHPERKTALSWCENKAVMADADVIIAHLIHGLWQRSLGSNLIAHREGGGLCRPSTLPALVFLTLRNHVLQALHHVSQREEEGV